MKKHYMMGGESLIDAEPKTKVTSDELQAVIKGDKYDDLRIKALQSSDYASQRENALKEVEANISKLKERDLFEMPSTTLKPLEDRVLILPDKPVNITDKGIWLPDQATDKALPETGLVVAKGPGRYINGILDPVKLNLGDRVFYGKYAGTPVPDKRTKETFLCMRYGDVFCIDE